MPTHMLNSLSAAAHHTPHYSYTPLEYGSSNFVTTVSLLSYDYPCVQQKNRFMQHSSTFQSIQSIVFFLYGHFAALHTERTDAVHDAVPANASLLPNAPVRYLDPVPVLQQIRLHRHSDRSSATVRQPSRLQVDVGVPRHGRREQCGQQQQQQSDDDAAALTVLEQQRPSLPHAAAPDAPPCAEQRVRQLVEGDRLVEQSWQQQQHDEGTPWRIGTKVPTGGSALPKRASTNELLLSDSFTALGDRTIIIITVVVVVSAGLAIP